VREQGCQGDGSEEKPGEEGASVAMVEVMAGFEESGVERVFGEQARIEEPIGNVERPDGEEHAYDADLWETKVIGRGDEPSPECGDCGGVEREQMP
jgi:hypothetical protein